jgi:hypothetical protein
VHTMRKLFALALMALALASFAMGCGKKAEETPPAATETSTMSSDGSMKDTTDASTMTAPDTTKK